MRSPLRLLSDWIEHQRLWERRQAVEWQLSLVLQRSLTLMPTVSGGGFDRIYVGQTNAWPSRSIAGVRMNCPQQAERAEEPQLPRRSLNAVQRISREARAYELLSPQGIAPELIARGEFFLANHWLPWPRVSEVLRRNPERLWHILPAVLSAVQAMHACGVVHMDLNCGNLLLAPDDSRVAIIDFEYAPRADMTQFDQQRFDFLRLAHNLLKRRRGREAAMQQPDRFVRFFARFAPESGFGIPEPLAAAGFYRVLENQTIRSGFQDLFGVFEFDRNYACLG